MPLDKTLPDPYSLCDWSNDIGKLPEISWRDVTEYLIDTPSVYTKEALKAYKSLEAYDYFVCGHVQDCFYPRNKHQRQSSALLMSEVRIIDG